MTFQANPIQLMWIEILAYKADVIRLFILYRKRRRKSLQHIFLKDTRSRYTKCASVISSDQNNNGQIYNIVRSFYREFIILY